MKNKHLHFHFLFTLFLSLTSIEATSAQNGNNDPNFNTVDVGFGFGDGFSGTVRSTITLPDGKIMVTGGFTEYNGTPITRLARLNADGTLDNSFNPGLGPDNVIYAMALQSDGKVIIGGLFTSYDGVTRQRIARINTDGTMDATFNSSTGAGGSVNAIAIQSDGKVLIGGGFTTYGGLTRNRIVRLNTNGTLDNTFSIGTGAGATVHSISIQSDGKVIIGGEFTTYNGSTRNRIARLNTDGSYDTSFTTGTGAGSIVYTTSVQGDGKIIIAGNFTTYNSLTRNRIVRLNSDGTLDDSFSIGTGANSAIWCSELQSDGKVLIGGNFTSYQGTTRNRIIRLNSDGSFDNSFAIGTGVSTSGDLVYSIKVQSDNKVIAAGFIASYNGVARSGLIKLNADATVDFSFSPGTGANKTVFTSAIQSDGKILIGGEFTSFNGVVVNYLARLNSDGSLDNTFNSGTGTNGIVYAIAVLSDGKIMIAGEFTTYNGITRNNIARLNSDGTLDTTFDPGTGANGAIRAMAIQSNGRIVIGGGFSTYNGASRIRVARVNTNGTNDTSFDPGSGAGNLVYAIAIQSDGKIVIGGAFTSYNSTTRNRIARVNANGTLDTTFNPSSGAGSTVWSIIIMPDQKILIGGNFTTFNGVTRNRIALVTTSGALDSGFNPGVGPGNTVFSLARQSDGKIIIGGQFTTYQSESISRNRIARINSDGTLDVSFNPGSGAGAIVRTVNLQSDGKIIVGGEFKSYNGVGRNRITRVLGNCSNVTGTDVIISNTAITWINGVTYTQSNNTATHTITNSSGCDSTVTLNLTITPAVIFDVNATNNQICVGDEVTISVGFLQGELEDLDCNNALFNGNLVESYASDGTTLVINYDNGNGGVHIGQVVNSTGVTGLTATLAPGSFLVGQGSLVYNLSGTPSSSGVATFDINIGGQTCIINRTVWPLPEYPAGYVHCNPSNPTQVIDVTNPVTGKNWMDRNLGANRAALSPTDAQAYGSLFQWGRFADGHQCVNRYSGDGVTTSGTTTTLSTTATPSHGNFIMVNNAQWQSPTVNNLWQGVNGINNPCPLGYRVPTQSELNAERLSWQQAPINSTNNIAGGFASPLKLTMGGRRNNSDGSVTNVGNYGSYWSSTAQAFEEISLDLFVNENNQAVVDWNHNRSSGVSVRCIKD